MMSGSRATPDGPCIYLTVASLSRPPRRKTRSERMMFFLLLRRWLWTAVLLPGAGWASPTNVAVRPLSLNDCFHIALEHNFDVKIARYNPEIQSHNLSAAYGAYEPVGSMLASRNYSETPGGLNVQNRPYVGTTAYEDTFMPGIAGILPTGLNYNFGGTLTGTTGTGPSGSFVNDSGQASVSVTQPLLRNLWIDSPRETIQVNKKALKISQLALRWQIMSSVTTVELAYYNLILAQEQVKVQEQAFQLAQRLVNESKAKVAAGAMARSMRSRRNRSFPRARPTSLAPKERCGPRIMP